MDRTIVFARTNKGHKEVAGRTTFLKHADRSVLFLVTGKESLNEIEKRIDPSIAKRLDSVMQKLVRDEFIYRAEPHEISAPPERLNAGQLAANGAIDTGSVVTMAPPEESLEPAVDSVPDDLVNALLRQAKESARRQGLVERMRNMEADARKKAAAPAASSARGMVLPAKRLQAAYTAHSVEPAAEPALDRKRILARSGKGALEFIGRTCTLRPGLQKILAQVDGVSTVEEILRRIGHSEKAVASGLETLLNRGYIQDSSAVLDGLEPDIDFDAGVSARQGPATDFVPERLAPVDIEAMEAERSTLADVWRELAAQQRRDLAAQAEEQSARVSPRREERVDGGQQRVDASRHAARTDPYETTFDHHRVHPATDGDWASEQFTRRARLRKPERRKSSLGRRAIAPLAVLGILMAVMAYLLAPFFDPTRYESAASRYFDERVRIGSASLSLWPRPALKLSDVRVGDESGGIRIENAFAHLGLEWLSGNEYAVPVIEIDGATVTAAELRALLQPAAQGKPNTLSLRRIQGKRIHIVDSSWKLNNASIDVEVGRNQAIRRLAVMSGDGSIKAHFMPAADGVINLEVSATKMPLFGAGLVLDQFEARGSYSADEFVLREFDGRLMGGLIHGQARIRQGATWVAEGTLETRGLDLAQIARPLFDDGSLAAKGKFRTSANTPHELFASGSIDGALTVDRGTFTGADLARVVLRDDTPRGSTLFTDLSGAFNVQMGSRVSINNVRFKANRIGGTATAQVDSNGSLRAQINGSLWTPQGPVSSSVDLGGSVRRPVLARRD